TFSEEALSELCQPLDGCDPSRLGLGCGLDRRDSSLARVSDDIGEVLRLFVQEMGEVRRERALHETHEVAVGKTVAVKPVEGRGAAGPLLAELHPAAPHHVVAVAPGIVGADLETGGEDQAVELVFDAADYDPSRRHMLDATTLGVD